MMFMLVSLLASCTDKTVDGYTGQLTIAVSDGTSSKAISFDPEDGYPAAMSHYTIEVYDEEDERVARTADKLPFTGGSGRFTVPGLITGTYRIEAEGYIQTGADEYIPIASGTAEATVSPASSGAVSIAIDSFDDEPGSASVSVVLPADASAGGLYTGTVSYSAMLLGSGEAEPIEGSVHLSGETSCTLAIDSIPAGRYVLKVTFACDGDTYDAADALLVFPGLHSEGTVDLDIRDPYDFGFTVTDGIGGEIAIGNDGGKYTSENGEVEIALDRPLSATETIL